MYETREAPLTQEQQVAYKDMMVKLSIEVAEGQVTAVNEAVMAQNMLQICGGIVYSNTGDHLRLNAKPRLDVILEVVEQSSSKVIVFVPFVGMVKMIQEHLEEHGHSTEAIYGGVSKSERDRIFSAFQTTSNPRVLVAQPAAMSHSLTLTAASTIVWAAPIASNDIFEQANARITRPGQKHSQLIVMVEGTPIERKYYQRLKDKQKIQGLLLDMIRDERISV
jgi:SNF2 family DNA or RNA helicase